MPALAYPLHLVVNLVPGLLLIAVHAYDGAADALPISSEAEVRFEHRRLIRRGSRQNQCRAIPVTDERDVVGTFRRRSVGPQSCSFVDFLTTGGALDCVGKNRVFVVNSGHQTLWAVVLLVGLGHIQLPCPGEIGLGLSVRHRGHGQDNDSE